MKKRLLTAVLIAALSVSLAGCGAAEPANESTVSAEETADAETAETTETAEESSSEAESEPSREPAAEHGSSAEEGGEETTETTETEESAEVEESATETEEVRKSEETASSGGETEESAPASEESEPAKEEPSVPSQPEPEPPAVEVHPEPEVPSEPSETPAPAPQPGPEPAPEPAPAPEPEPAPAACAHGSTHEVVLGEERRDICGGGGCYDTVNIIGAVCDSCGETVSTREYWQNAIAHISITIQGGAAPTCTEDGYGAITSCGCGALYTDGSQNITPAKGHHFRTQCTGEVSEDGMTAKWISICGSCNYVEREWWE